MAKVPTGPLSYLSSGPADVASDNVHGIEDVLSRMVAGNTALNTHPHMVSAMLNGGGTYADTQALNQFLVGMHTYFAIHQAHAQGYALNLSQQESDALQAMGFDFNNLQADNPLSAAVTPAQRQQQFQNQLNTVRQQVNHPGDHSGPGWGFNLHSVGRALYDVTHNPVTDALGDIPHDVIQTANIVPNTLSFFGDNSGGDVHGMSPDEQRQMRLFGYDPSSYVSQLAWRYSGHATMMPGANQYTGDAAHDAMVDDAMKYASDPDQYLKDFFNQPDLTQQDVLDFKAKMNNPDFKATAARINANTVTPGNGLAAALQIDAFNHPDLYKAVAVPTDIAFMFALDPTLVAGKLMKGIRATQVAVESAGDSTKVLRVFTDSKTLTLPDGTSVSRIEGYWADGRRAAMSSFIDNNNKLREWTAKAASGDPEAKQQVAYYSALIRNQTPGLVHLMDDFAGANRFETSADGQLIPVEGKPITNMAEAAEYLSSKTGIVRLMAGRPLTESRLIPGHLSTYGFLRWRGALASKTVRWWAGRTDAKYRDAPDLITGEGGSPSAIDLREVADRVVATPVDKVATADGRVIRDLGNGFGEVTDPSGFAQKVMLTDNGDGTHTLTRFSRVLDVGNTDPFARAVKVLQSRGRMSIAYMTNPNGSMRFTVGTARRVLQQMQDEGYVSAPVKALLDRGPGYQANLTAGLRIAAEEGTVTAIKLAEDGMPLTKAKQVISDLLDTKVINPKGQLTEKGLELKASGKMPEVPAPPISNTDEYHFIGERKPGEATRAATTETVASTAIIPKGGAVPGLPSESRSVVGLVGELGDYGRLGPSAVRPVKGPALSGEVAKPGAGSLAAAYSGDALRSRFGAGTGLRDVTHLDEDAGDVPVYPGSMSTLTPEEAAVEAIRGTYADVARRGDLAFKKRGGILTPGKETVQQGLRLRNLKNMPLATAKGWLNPFYIWNRQLLNVQRWFSYLPKSVVFHTGQADGAEQVFRYANMYLNRSDAHVISAMYATGTAAERKAILTGLQIQVMHAAGIGVSESSADFLSQSARALLNEKYGITTRPFIDSMTGLERDAAIWPSDVNDTLTLRSFKELQILSAKTGLWEATLGRGLNHAVTQALMGIVRIGWLTSFTNVIRNSAEDLIGAYSRGEYGVVNRAKIAGKDVIPARSRVGNFLAGQGRNRLGRWMMFIPANVARAKRWALVRTGSSDDLRAMDYISSLDRDSLVEFADNFMRMRLESYIDPYTSRDVDEITRAGFKATPVQFRAGFGAASTHESLGHDVFADALGRVFNPNMGLASKILDHLDDPAAVPLTDIIDMLRNDPRVSHMIRAGQYQMPDGTVVKVPYGDAAGRDIALRQLAESQVREIDYLTSLGGDGARSRKLVDYIRANRAAPNGDWIHKNVPLESRPEHVLAPIFMPAPTTEGIANWVGTISDNLGKGYQWMVERPITRISSMPIFLSNYGDSRVFLEPWEKELVAGGLDPKVADLRAQEVAMGQAWRRTMKYIDDPTTRTGLDATGRGFFSFSRATQAFVRRWATQWIEDPTRLRKLMLAHEAAIKTGVIYEDPNGNEQFAFPGSGMAVTALMALGSLLPGVNLLALPLSNELTGSVQYLNPGLSNPFQLGLSPMINIPMHAIQSAFPQYASAWEWIDQHTNGSTGPLEASKALKSQLWDELAPTIAKKLSDAMDTDERNSMLADAFRSAVLTMYNADQFPSPQDSAAKKQRFLTDMQTQIKGQLFVKAIFALFMPAPPSLDENGDFFHQDLTKPDWFASAIGARSFKDEYRIIVNQVGGDIGKANAIWATLHPDQLQYTIPATEVGSKGGYVNPTAASLNWIQNNVSFFKDYGQVAPYFVPQSLQQGNFDLNAYHAELLMGIRQNKSMDEFYDGVATASAAQLYYQQLDRRDAMVQAHPEDAKAWRDGFTQWKRQFFSLNPLFAQTQSDYETSVNYAHTQLDQLKGMLANPSSVPSDVPLQQLGQMVDAYNTYHNSMSELAGGSNTATAMRAQVTSQYNQYMNALVQAYPQLQGLYVGVFRTLDDKALDPLGAGS